MANGLPASLQHPTLELSGTGMIDEDARVIAVSLPKELQSLRLNISANEIGK